MSFSMLNVSATTNRIQQWSLKIFKIDTVMVMLAIFIKMVTIELEIEKEIREARVSKKVKAITLAIHESI
jgi:hypothetical protein